MHLSPALWRILRSIGIGVFVGTVFLMFARDRVERAHQGNPSGLLHISQQRFDRNPMINERPDLRARLFLESTDGYDGQYFYFMAFDPLVTKYQHRPRSYSRVVDSGPYRFGRPGFAWLTRLVSFGREERYPISMIALVLCSLGLCGALLAWLAQQRTLSAWYGALVLAIPGFWQTAVLTTPEPLAFACIVCGVLLVDRQRWVLAGLSLALAMLTRETSGALVLAIPAALLLTGLRRESLVVALLAFAPVVMWKAYLGWIFYPAEGLRAFTPHPDDLAFPFAGMWQIWTEFAQKAAGAGWSAPRSGILFTVLVLAAVAMATAAFLKRRAPMTAAALFYAWLAITFSYGAVWLYLGNAERLTIDLFAALALVSLDPQVRARIGPRSLIAFWSAAALYVLFGMQESVDIRRMFT